MASPCQQAAAMGEYQPRLHWGLDPVHCSSVKFYIKDVLEMSEYPTCPGAYAYLNHPVIKVDIMGYVVEVDEKTRFISYSIDDGTGAIRCVCWKPKQTSSADMRFDETFKVYCASNDVSFNNSISTLECLNELANSVSESKSEHVLKLGDFVHIRGKVKEYKKVRDISVSYSKKIDDPTGSIEMARMLELPTLYENVYDKPFLLPRELAEEIESLKEERQTGLKTEERIVRELQEKVINFLKINNINSFEITDLQTVSDLIDIAQQPCKEYTQITETSMRKKATATQIHTIFKKVVHVLEELGIAYKESYKYKVVQDGDHLEKTIVNIIQQDSQKPKYKEKGCHYMHVVDCLHQYQQYKKVTMTTVLQILDKLESQSDVISTSHRHYIAFSNSS
ncbi:CST complex subunit STN1-like [Saccoglossus kowalevskii]|uniref:CST complex subunit STN1 n=1 Tax=Saccoglossus kowalevskii TaxID=10224 RepID=A0ABM0GZX7_SACKO|nr:PREDICTED: CST complex subunit STN1-like [Saccoglossus kowalevskii]